MWTARRSRSCPQRRITSAQRTAIGDSTPAAWVIFPEPVLHKGSGRVLPKAHLSGDCGCDGGGGRPFTGVIFFGLMLTEDGPKVLEYNARLVIREAQVVLPRMKNDIIDVMEACVDGKLDTIDLQFEDNAAVCVVLASDGYPVSYEKGFPITGLEKFDGKDDYFCFHAGTKFDENGTIVTNGGRCSALRRLERI